MDSNAAHSPVFLLFPSDINSPEYQSSELTATTYKSQNLIQKFFVTKMKILGFIISGAFLIALKRKSTETLMNVSQIVNFSSALGATAGIILLIFGFLLDRNYICGYSQESTPCNAITILFIGLLIMLMIFSIIELFISLPFAIWGCHSANCHYKECF
uniref:Membrane-spanning 4-domains subfamily A member 5 n=1 Tax=Castor canadensis TaxID=51338 RepID=A0A8C0XWB3_CASCN